jgi:hypothetical protein
VKFVKSRITLPWAVDIEELMGTELAQKNARHFNGASGESAIEGLGLVTCGASRSQRVESPGKSLFEKETGPKGLGPECVGRYWTRTSDLIGVNDAL